ncbi:MAG TPA: methyltransferase domain-containing protein, partial [Flavipsychrobacter sp.]|nr:methyltransferase domain-containing protein [Flavipsychrobacter sp.]
IEDFLKRNSLYVKGRALEIGDNYYTRQFGKEHVTKSDVLHIDKNNPAATITGDLSDLSHIADNSFDCIILTQTLHLIYDHNAALQTCHRILSENGVLLITVPGITNIDQGEWGKTWYWSFTETSMKRMLTDVFGEQNIQLSCYGNILSATAFLYGAGVNEISNEEKDVYDPHYPVIIAAIATKKEKP